MSLLRVPCVISAGQSLSDGVDCTGAGQIIRISMPPDWTAAPMSFQLSPDNAVYRNLYHTTADAFSVFEVRADVVPGVVVVFPTNMGGGISWMKIRSGTSAVPVVQAADRAFTVTLDIPDAAAGGGSDLTAALSAMFAPIVTGAVMNPSIADMTSNPPGSAVVQMQAGNGNYTTMVPPPTWTIFSETLNGTATSGWWTIDQYGNLIPASTTASRLNVDDYAVVRCEATNAFGSGVGDCMMTFAA